MWLTLVNTLKHAAGIAPCKTAAGKVPGMSRGKQPRRHVIQAYKGQAAQKAYKPSNYRSTKQSQYNTYYNFIAQTISGHIKN